MRNLTLVATLGLMAAGCNGPGSWEGIWMIQVPVVESESCDPDIDHNYKDASVPEEVDFEGDPDWDVDYDTKVSDAVFFLQVLEQGGDVFVFYGDTPYYGTVDGKTLTASWTDFVDSEVSEAHDNGYEYTADERSESTTAFALTRDGGVVTGTYDFQVKTTLDYVETDEWTPNDVGFQQGQMNGIAGVYLENDAPGGTQNGANDDDCDGGECELSVKYNCTTSTPIQAFFAGDHDEGMFEGVKDAERDFGGGFGYGGGGDYGSYY